MEHCEVSLSPPAGEIIYPNQPKVYLTNGGYKLCSDICLEEEINLCGDGINSNFYNQTIIIEACDDGNQVSGDGCSADCLFVEPGYECLEWGKPCTLLCGNGLVEEFYLSKLTEDG